MAEVGKGRRQSPNDIGEAACLEKRHTLGCRERNMHRTSQRGDLLPRGRDVWLSYAEDKGEMSKHQSLTVESKEGQRA